MEKSDHWIATCLIDGIYLLAAAIRPHASVSNEGVSKALWNGEQEVAVHKIRVIKTGNKIPFQSQPLVP